MIVRGGMGRFGAAGRCGGEMGRFGGAGRFSTTGRLAGTGRFAFLAAAVALVVSAPPTAAQQYAEAGHAMVVSRQVEASRVGAEVLRDGGSAVDAAVAVSMALAVVLPQAGNIGGGGFLLFRRASDGFTTCIDFRETAPAAAHRNIYIGAGSVVDTSRVREGHQAVGVPGTVAGLHLAWSRYGHLPWASLIQPAIELAEKGFMVNGELADAAESERDKLAKFPGAAALFLPRGRPVGVGRRIVQPELAKTLRAIAESGPQAFYTGAIGDLIVREMEQGGGWITRDDLARYQPIEREPLRGSYRDLEILSAPPPSSGGVAILQTLGILEGFDLRSFAPRPGVDIHLVVEAMSRAFADRNTYLGDPAFVRVPVSTLLDRGYLEKRRSGVSADRATPARFVLPGNVSAFESGSVAPAASHSPGAAGTSAAGHDSLGAIPDSNLARPGVHADSSATSPDSTRVRLGVSASDSIAAQPDSTAPHLGASASDSTAAPPDSNAAQPAPSPPDSSAARPDSTGAQPAPSAPDSSTARPDSGATRPHSGGARLGGAASPPDRSVAPPDSSRRESSETTHVSIVDAEGNIVSMSTTLNGNFGSGVVVRGAGFLLNNEMDDFDAQPGVANQFGLVGGDANSIEPGKRMLSSMAPLIVLRDGRPWLVLGARGGPRIITTLVEILLNVHDFGMDLWQAVAAKRYHNQWIPDVLWYEPGALSGEAMDRLRRMGHDLQEQGPKRSSAQCIEITPQGRLRGVSDPRAQGGAVGY
jgi:gamma-glutamyltranspeptidase